MRVLLDTHAFLWWAAGDTRLPVAARHVIENEDTEVLLSAASVWEITTKVRLGKLPSPGNITTLMRDGRISGLPITPEHACAAGSLPGPHKDPFDRMLIAQAVLEAIPMISNEAAFNPYGVRRIWESEAT